MSWVTAQDTALEDMPAKSGIKAKAAPVGDEVVECAVFEDGELKE